MTTDYESSRREPEVDFREEGAPVPDYGQKFRENAAAPSLMGFLDAVTDLQFKKRARAFLADQVNQAEDDLERLEEAYNIALGEEAEACVALLNAVEQETNGQWAK